MSQAITDKTWFISYQRYQIWITEQEANNIKQALNKSSDNFIEVQGRVIPIKSCALLKAEDSTLIEKQKRGEWKCEHGHWHSRNQECGHGIGSRIFL